MNTLRAGLVATMACFVLAVSACAGATNPASTAALETTPPGSLAVVPTEPPTAVATTEPPIALDVPQSCDAVISVTDVAEIVGIPMMAVPWSEVSAPDGSSPADHLPGPIARDAARNARERLDCMWWPTGGGRLSLPIHVLRLDAAVHADFVASLEASTEYVPSSIAGYAVFLRDYENEVHGLSLSYAMVDDVWVAIDTPFGPDERDAVMTQVIANLTSH